MPSSESNARRGQRAQRRVAWHSEHDLFLGGGGGGYFNFEIPCFRHGTTQKVACLRSDFLFTRQSDCSTANKCVAKTIAPPVGKMNIRLLLYWYYNLQSVLTSNNIDLQFV